MEVNTIPTLPFKVYCSRISTRNFRGRKLKANSNTSDKCFILGSLDKWSESTLGKMFNHPENTREKAFGSCLRPSSQTTGG